MKEQLLELYGFIQESIKREKDYSIKHRLQYKLGAIEVLLEDLPYGLTNIIDEFEREIK